MVKYHLVCDVVSCLPPLGSRSSVFVPRIAPSGAIPPRVVLGERRSMQSRWEVCEAKGFPAMLGLPSACAKRGLFGVPSHSGLGSRPGRDETASTTCMARCSPLAGRLILRAGVGAEMSDSPLSLRLFPIPLCNSAMGLIVPYRLFSAVRC